MEPQLEHRNALSQRVAHFPKQKRTIRENHNQRGAGERNQKLSRVQTAVKHLTEVDKRKEIKTIERKNDFYLSIRIYSFLNEGAACKAQMHCGYLWSHIRCKPGLVEFLIYCQN